MYRTEGDYSNPRDIVLKVGQDADVSERLSSRLARRSHANLLRVALFGVAVGVASLVARDPHVASASTASESGRISMNSNDATLAVNMGDNPGVDRPTIPVGPDAFPGPNTSTSITIEGLLDPAEVKSRAEGIEPRFITAYAGKDPSGEKELQAENRIRNYLAGAEAYNMGSVAESARWIAREIQVQRNQTRNTENGMTVLAKYEGIGYVRLGVMATPLGCSAGMPDRNPSKCPPTDSNLPIEAIRNLTYDPRGLFFLNHVLVAGEVDGDPRNLEHMVRLVQVKEGITLVNREVGRYISEGRALDLNAINKVARDGSWYAALESTRTLKKALPEDWWDINPEFAAFYEGFENAFAVGGEEEARKFITENQIQ